MAFDFTKNSAVAKTTEALFGQPLVTNVYRGILVEAMIAEALQGSWTWVSRDWAPHDFENGEGVRLEVKQSAAVQSWGTKPGAIPRPSFDIARRKLMWCENEQGWTKEATRPEIYVFAYHSVLDRVIADHRDPMQWEFYAVGETDLPQTKRISLRQVQLRATATRIDILAEAVAKLMDTIPADAKQP